MLLTKGIKDVLLSTDLWPTCQVDTALERSISLTISASTDSHESDGSIIMVDGKLSPIMFHRYSVHAPHVWDSGLILVVTDELEVPVKTMVGGMPTYRGMTCGEKLDIYSIHICHSSQILLLQKHWNLNFAASIFVNPVCTHLR